MARQLLLSDNSTNNKLPTPRTHEAHYLMHRYWGRKPVNVFRHIIEKYSRKNDLILDPFMGSGITVIESNLLERKAIGIDLNPLSKFIVDVTLKKLETSSRPVDV